jgi:hypothetical protein
VKEVVQISKQPSAAEVGGPSLDPHLATLIQDLDLGTTREISGVSLNAFKTYRSNLLKSQIKYDFHAEIEKLFLQAPSTMHEQSVWFFSNLFCTVMSKQREMAGGRSMGVQDWGILSNIPTSYEDDKGGEFIADLTLRAKNITLLLLEVAFTQSRVKVRDKAKRMLLLEKIVGVILVHIQEKTAFEFPEKPQPNASRDNLAVDYFGWHEKGQAAKKEGSGAFDAISVYGWNWVQEVECVVEIIPKDGDPYSAVLSGTGPIFLPQLDLELAEIWEDHVHTAAQLCGSFNFHGSAEASNEMDFASLECDWTVLRTIIEEAMVSTGYDRYCRWCGLDARKRKNEENYSKLVTVNPVQRRLAKKRRLTADASFA